MFAKAGFNRVFLPLGVRLKSFLVSLLAASALPVWLGAETLPLTEYLSQVKKENPGILSLQANNAALDVATAEVETAFSPYAMGGASYLDARTNPYPGFNPNHVLDFAWNAGLSKTWGTGTMTSLNLQSDSNRLLGLPGALAAFFPPDFYFTDGLSLTVSQPLWKNVWAKGTRATMDKVGNGAGAQQALGKFQVQQTLFQAEQAYWSLALARAAVQVQTESLERNRKILEWNESRAQSGLGDRSDVLQSQAAVKQIQIGLRQAQDDAGSAELAFNDLRNQPGAGIEDDLEAVEAPDDIEAKSADRADLVAAQKLSKSQDAAVSEIIDRYSPDISVFTTLTLNGGGTNASDAFSQSTGSSTYPSTLVGVKANVNLDLPLLAKVRRGAALAADSGSQGLKQKKLDLDRDWTNLKRSWEGVKERLALADSLLALQKEKAEHEKNRLSNGRSTVFQVLRFDDDYAQARLLRMRVAMEARLVAAQAKLYNGDY
jgi:outer membrane protein TolC